MTSHRVTLTHGQRRPIIEGGLANRWTATIVDMGSARRDPRSIAVLFGLLDLNSQL
jgi:hypothetical protein